MAHRRVMIVDPSLYSRAVLSNILHSHGYSVCFEARNAKEALENYEKARPDFVLVEAHMPDTDGVATIRALCRQFDGCRPMLCAGRGQRSLVCEALSAGAVDFIPKPFNERAVIRTLARHAGG